MGKYKKLYGTLLLGLIAIIILLTAVFSYSRSIEESYKEENINSLKELSNQGALMLHNEIKNKQNLLAELSHDVSRIFVNDPQAAAAVRAAFQANDTISHAGLPSRIYEKNAFLTLPVRPAGKIIRPTRLTPPPPAPIIHTDIKTGVPKG